MPQRTPTAERRSCRTQHPTWGGRKLHARLQALGYPTVPAPSTNRDSPPRRLAPRRRGRPQAGVERFEPHPQQMDFKGHFPVAYGRAKDQDDCSRFALCLHACPNEQGTTVQTHLTQTFRRYGLEESRLDSCGV